MRNLIFVACATIGLAVNVVSSPAHAVVNYADGATHTESGATSDRFTISGGSKVNFQGSGSATPPVLNTAFDAINVVGGSQVTLAGGYTVTASNTAGMVKGFSLTDSRFTGTGGTVNVVGGSSEAVVSYGAGNVTLNGPTLSARLYDSGNGTFASGGFAYGYAATDSTQTTITAANVSAVGSRDSTQGFNTFAAAVVGFGTTRTVINGGTFSAVGDDAAYTIVASQQAVVEIHGGNISFAAGRIGHHLTAFSTSTIKVYGSNFQLNGTAVVAGRLVALGGYVQGTLEDGTSFGYDVYRDATGTIELVSVPEPSGLGLLVSAAALATCRRRRV